MKKLAKMHDSRTKKASQIPAGKLAPMNAGVPIVVSSNVNLHPPCDEDVRDYFREIKASLDEVYPQTMEEWEDGFLKDLFPEQEIAIWLRIARVYRQCTAGKSLSQDERQEYFSTLLLCSFAPRDPQQIGPGKWISQDERRKAVSAFYGRNGNNSGMAGGCERERTAA